METYIKELDSKKDSDLLFEIVKYEDEIFREASVGNWNIKPFAKYGKVFAILTEKNEIVSVIEVLSSFDREKAYLYGVSTSKKFQKKGYGKKLLDYVLKYLIKIGIKTVELTADEDNIIAQNLYSQFGFEIVENLSNEYGDNVPRYLMRLDLKK